MNLTPSEFKVYNALLKCNGQTLSELLGVLYAGRADGGPLWAESTLRVHIYRVRQELGGLGQRLYRQNGSGKYWLLLKDESPPCKSPSDALTPTFLQLYQLIKANSGICGSDIAEAMGLVGRERVSPYVNRANRLLAKSGLPHRIVCGKAYAGYKVGNR